MKSAEAYAVLAPIIMATTGWDDKGTDGWASMLEKLEDYAAAQRAMEVLANTWVKPGRPPWGEFKRLYENQPKRNHYRELPTQARLVSLEYYLERLDYRAKTGDLDAVELMAAWAKLSKGSNIWARMFGEAE